MAKGDKVVAPYKAPKSKDASTTKKGKPVLDMKPNLMVKSAKYSGSATRKV